MQMQNFRSNESKNDNNNKSRKKSQIRSFEFTSKMKEGGCQFIQKQFVRKFEKQVFSIKVLT